MSFRGIWVVAKDHQEKGRLLLTRKYPTVERRWRLINGKASVSNLPDDERIIACVFEKLQIGRKTKEFVEKCDGCKQRNKEPVMKVEIDGEELWPVIVLQKFQVVLICLCLVEKKELTSNSPLVEIPAISIGYSLLHNLMEYLELVPLLHSNDQLLSHVEELGTLLKILMPFGTPADIDLSQMKHFLYGEDIKYSPMYRHSAWRPLANTKTRNHVQLNIKEQFNAVIYNETKRAMYKNICSVYGSVSCKADIDGVPEVRMNLTCLSNIHLVFHPCLQSLDVKSTTDQDYPESYLLSDSVPVSKSLCFVPPCDLFPLCHMNGDSVFPVQGEYEVDSGKGTRDICIKLELHERMKNSFEYFEVHIPFFKCGTIHKWDFDNTIGTVLMSPEKRKLVWSIGQRFPKNMKTSLNARVLLLQSPSVMSVMETCDTFTDDPFCSGPITYIELHFKSTNNTFSAINIDPKSIKVNPTSSPKINIVKELVSYNYKIWNTYGDAHIAFPPTL